MTTVKPTTGWRRDDKAARKLCGAATRRLVGRLRELEERENETFGEAWDRMIAAMADEPARTTAVARGATSGVDGSGDIVRL